MSRTKRHDFWTSSTPKLFSTIPINMGTTLATLCMYQFTSTTPSKKCDHSKANHGVRGRQNIAWPSDQKVATAEDSWCKAVEATRKERMKPRQAHNTQKTTHPLRSSSQWSCTEQTASWLCAMAEWSCIFNWHITRAPQDTMHYYFVTGGNNNTYFFQHAPPPHQTSGGPPNKF